MKLSGLFKARDKPTTRSAPPRPSFWPKRAEVGYHPPFKFFYRDSNHRHLPLHVCKTTDKGNTATDHLYRILHDEPNREMTFILRKRCPPLC